MKWDKKKLKRKSKLFLINKYFLAFPTSLQGAGELKP
jgi:hypothetical protein